MDQFKIKCPKCGKSSVRFLDPEIRVNKVRCTGCDNTIEVKFRNNEIQLWSEIENDKKDSDCM